MAGVVWGSIPIFVRMVDVSPFVIVFWRVAFGAATALIYLLITGKVKELKHLRGRGILALLALGALLAVNWVLFFGAFALTRVAVVELISYTGPVFVAALAPLAIRERFDLHIVVPLVLALGGTALIFGMGGLSGRDDDSLWGALMAFGTALIYAGLMLTSKRLLRTIDPPVLAFGEYVFAAILLLPAVFLLPGPTGGKEWGALATLGAVHTTIAILVFLSGLRRVRADHAAVFTYAEPVTAVIFAAIFLAEPLGWATAVGGALVVTAGVLVARMAPRATVEPAGVEAAGLDGMRTDEAADLDAIRTEEATGVPAGAERLESAKDDFVTDTDRSQR